MIAKNKKIEPVTGQLLSVPMLNGSLGLAQVAFAHKLDKKTYTVALAFFPIQAETVDELVKKINFENLKFPFAIVSPSSTPIEDGEIMPIGTAGVEYENVDVPSRLKGSYQWFDGRQRPWRFIFDMYYGLYPWDAFHNKNWMDELLLTGYDKPITARLKKDFLLEELEKFGLNI